MTILEGFILGLVQGVTEVLPVSSTAHLILAQKLMGIDTDNLSFDVMMNFGSLIAIIIYFWDIWLDLIVGMLNFIKIKFNVWLSQRPHIKQYIPRFNKIETQYSKQTIFYTESLKSAKLLFFLILATIPALMIGYISKNWIEDYTRNVIVIALALILGGVMLGLADYLARQKYALSTISPIKVIFIGFFQVLALIPGFSRTGSVMTGALFLGLNRKDSAAFAFLLGAPVIFIATIATLPDFIVEYSYSLASLVAFMTSGIVTYCTIHILYNIIQKQSFKVFVAYRLILGILLLITVYTKIL
ncbi:MAG: undecaprenyl-diphosphate phosphatase [Candidatus Paceibacterota bacterium]